MEKKLTTPVPSYDSKLRVVLFGKNDRLNRIIQETLTKAGCETDWVFTVNEALEKITGSHDEVLLLEYKLPDMDAIQFIGLLTEKYEKVPVFIVMTGLGDIQQAINMMKLGAKDYIIKDTQSTHSLKARLNETINGIRNNRKLSFIEKELDRSNLKYHNLFNKMINGFATHRVIYNSKGKAIDYITTEVNPAYVKLLNIKEESIVGKKISEVLSNEEVQEWLKIFEPVAVNGKSIRYEMYSNYFEKYFEGIAFSSEKNMFSVTFSEITKRKKAEKELAAINLQLEASNQQLVASEQQLKASNQQLKANEQQLRAANQQLKANELELRKSKKTAESYLDISAEIILKLNTKGEIALLNDSGYKLLGYEKGTLENKNWFYTCVPDNLREERFNRFQETIKKGRTDLLSLDSEIITKSGERKFFLWHHTVLKENGEILGTLSSGEDITERKNAEQEIQKTNLFLNAVIENSPIPNYVTDQNGTLVRANKALLKHLNVTEKDVIGIYSLLEDQNILEQNLMHRVKDVFQKKEQVRFSMQWFGDQSGFESLSRSNNPWVDVTMFPILNGEGRLENVVCQWIDISEQKEAETKLRESEKRLKKILENSPDAIFITDVTGNYVYVNTEASRLLGYSKKELLQRNVIDIVDRFSRENDIRAYSKLFSGKKQSFETILIHKKGTTVPVELNAVLLEDNRIYASCRDITARKEQEKQLIQSKLQAEENEKTFHNLFNHLNSGVAVYEVIENGKDFIFKYFNDAAERIDRQKREELIGKSFFEVRPNYEEFGLIETFRKVLQTKQPQHHPVSLYKDDKLEGYYENYVFLLPSGELVAVFDDITEQVKFENELKQAKEKAEEADKLKSAFLANMSHEIRTPMNGILGFAGLLQEPGLTGEDQQRYIQVIQKSGERMLNTVNDIIEISKIETGQVIMNYRQMNINKHMITLYNFFSQEAEEKGLELSIETVLSDDDAIIETDKNKISSVLTNLIKNAIKYTKSGSIKIGCTKKDDTLEFYVRDTGIGIPENRRVAIFNRFEQADFGVSRIFEGSGLGLSIAKSYVEMLGGEIWVESEENVGSTFYFTILPVDEREKNRMLKNESGTRDKLSAKSIKVLVAEDDEISRLHLDILLRNIVKEIIWAGTGTEAVEKVKNNPDIDIVLMDIRMPEMDGLEATHRIRGFNRDVVIIAQTAFALEGDREKAIDAGCDDYISKPIIESELMQKIRKYFNDNN